ncbi:glycosyltransferase family 2 protein [Sphingobacterium sp. HJSM2_6]|uniref:glycosyltransferase family 2 protein n=1 Tax=Sphingobacterium sp. HJSM2_6 TaxID=3366264 RepID=UPI003BD7B8AC
MFPEISIVVPCYMQGQYLEECLDSVLNQNFTDWECIIVNDGSTDETDRIVKEWLLKDSRFIYIKQKNQGISSARNTGLQTAKGNWIQFLDCDDLIEKNKLLASSKFFDQDIDLILSGYRYFESFEGPKFTRIIGRNNFLPEVCIDRTDQTDRLALFFEKNPFVISSPLYKASIFKEIGGFDERLSALEDWEFNLRCGINGYVMQHIGYLPETKTLIRLHQSSLMRNNKVMDINLTKFKQILEQEDQYKEKYQLFKKSKNQGEKKSIKEVLFMIIPPILLLFYRKFTQKNIKI